MAEQFKQKDFNDQKLEIINVFGGGINSRGNELNILDDECVTGANFILDLENKSFRPRPGFDLAGTATNAGQINGFAQLIKQDGTTSTLVQAGTTVYKWDGTTFTSVGTVAAGTKMRGKPFTQNWTLGNKVLITDLALKQPVMTWDGTTLANQTFSGITGNFLAKYCFVEQERAIFANVISNSSATPHLIVASKSSDYTTLSLTNVPSNALGVGDPFYLITPDLKPVNGILNAFGRVVFSSTHGKTFQLTGTNATNFDISDLYQLVGASGDEAIEYIGDDIAIGWPGRIATLFGTLNYGNVEILNLTRKIADQTLTLSNWTLVYNRTTQILYCFPGANSSGNTNFCFTLFVPLHADAKGTRFFSSGDFGRIFQGGGAGVSPWGMYTTSHSMGFSPTAVMSMLDPLTGLENIFMGDSSGNIYRMEGAGFTDGGTNNIISTRTSKIFSLPLDVEVFDVEGFIEYKGGAAATVTIGFKYDGSDVSDETITVNIPADSTTSYFGGNVYFGGAYYFGSSFSGRLRRQRFGVAGKSSQMQIVVTVNGSQDFEITRIEARFKAAT